MRRLRHKSIQGGDIIVSQIRLLLQPLWFYWLAVQKGINHLRTPRMEPSAPKHIQGRFSGLPRVDMTLLYQLAKEPVKAFTKGQFFIRPFFHFHLLSSFGAIPHANGTPCKPFNLPISIFIQPTKYDSNLNQLSLN